MSADAGPSIDVTRMPDGMPVASRDAPVGGQAVLEGVMMRGVSTWAVAVRKPAPEGPDAPSRRSARSRSPPSRSSRGRSATGSCACR